MAFALKEFLPRFDQICQEKFGRTYDLAALECHFHDLGSGTRHLSAQDVRKLFSAENSPYGKYWPRPHMQSLEETLRERRLRLGLPKAAAKALIQDLLSVFHNIGIVSLIMRFRP